MRKLIFALLPPILACATTGKEQGGSKPTSADYAPYKLGASWTYAINYLGQKGEQKITIVKEEEGYFVDDQQGKFRHTQEGLRDPARYLIRHPLEEGNEWKVILSASSVEHYRITSVGKPCESNAGRFEDCLVVESKNRQDDKMTLLATFFWARGIGLVKIETEAEIKGKGRVPQTERSLIHYSLDPSKPSGGDEDAPSTWTK
jgi:hypothetical protein